MSRGQSVVKRRLEFPSPRGDKLCRGALARQFIKQGFRPLAGISCVWTRPAKSPTQQKKFPSPRGDKLCPQNPGQCHRSLGFPSPRGDKLCPAAPGRSLGPPGFRPLAGISCVAGRCGGKASSRRFRPLAGISCVRKTAQLEPVGFRPGSDRITISHSTAAGKWQLEIKIPLIFLREPLQTAMQVAAMETRFAQSAGSH